MGKKLYYAIVKSLHPDLHPNQSDEKIRLFHNAVIAYENGDLYRLRVIKEMTDGPVAMTDNKFDTRNQLDIEKERLLNLIQIVKGKISKTKSEYPYTMKSLLQSPQKTEARKAELAETIKQLNETLAAYESKIKEMLE